MNSHIISVDFSPLSLPRRESRHHCLLFKVGETETKALSLVNRWRLEKIQVVPMDQLLLFLPAPLVWSTNPDTSRGQSPPGHLPSEEFDFGVLRFHKAYNRLSNLRPRKWKPEVLPTIISSLLARAGPRGRDRVPPSHLPLLQRGGLALVTTVQTGSQAGDRAGSKAHCFLPGRSRAPNSSLSDPSPTQGSTLRPPCPNPLSPRQKPR